MYIMRFPETLSLSDLMEKCGMPPRTEPAEKAKRLKVTDDDVEFLLQKIRRGAGYNEWSTDLSGTLYETHVKIACAITPRREGPTIRLTMQPNPSDTIADFSMKSITRGFLDLEHRYVLPAWREWGIGSAALDIMESIAHHAHAAGKMSQHSIIAYVSQLDVLCLLYNRGFRPTKSSEGILRNLLDAVEERSVMLVERSLHIVPEETFAGDSQWSCDCRFPFRIRLEKCLRTHPER